MEDLGKIIGFLYSQFLLRDLAGKVVPGSIILISILLGVSCPRQLISLVSGIPLGAWIILFPILWVIGLAVQAIGVQLKLIQYSLKYPPPDDFHDNLRRFRDTVMEERDHHQLERFMAIREAYGNTATTILLSFVLWAVIYRLTHVEWPTIRVLLIVFIVSLLLTISLFIGHYETLKNQDAFWSKAIKDSGATKSKDS